MMQYEFEELAGYKVSCDDYNKIIEPMYMAVNMNKRDFVKCIDKKRFALKTEKQLIADMRKNVSEVMEYKFGAVGTWENEKALRAICDEYKNRFGFEWYYFMPAYTCPSLKRGCTYPYKVVFYNDGSSYQKSITLDKEYEKRFGNL